MIVLANVLIIISIFTLISYPLVFGIIQWSVIYEDGVGKGLELHEIRKHQIYSLVLPFGIGLLQYFKKIRTVTTDSNETKHLNFKKDVWIKNFKVMLYCYPVLLTFSTILLIYIKYL